MGIRPQRQQVVRERMLGQKGQAPGIPREEAQSRAELVQSVPIFLLLLLIFLLSLCPSLTPIPSTL